MSKQEVVGSCVIRDEVLIVINNAVASRVHSEAVLVGDVSSPKYDDARCAVDVSMVQVQTFKMCKYEICLMISAAKVTCLVCFCRL